MVGIVFTYPGTIEHQEIGNEVEKEGAEPNQRCIVINKAMQLPRGNKDNAIPRIQPPNKTYPLTETLSLRIISKG